MKRLPRLTRRRILIIWAAAAIAIAVVLGVSRTRDDGLGIATVSVLALLAIASTLPFVAYALSPAGAFTAPPGQSLRPPRMPRLTTRRLVALLAMIVVGFCAMLLREQFSRNPDGRGGPPPLTQHRRHIVQKPPLGSETDLRPSRPSERAR